MSDHIELKPRKTPQQERSRQMCERIIQAAIRVLSEEGALGFTTTRVADEAEVSVGSLYQYFPNKHALAIAVHDEYVRHGLHDAAEIINDPDAGQRQILTRIVHWFFDSEAEEVDELGTMFADLSVFLHHTPTLTDEERALLEKFAERLDLDTETARFATTAIEALGKATAAAGLSATEREVWTDRCAAMLADHLQLS